MKRKIIRIDEDLCTGCGACIPDCPEGALQLIDGKARLVSDLFCDGLGACIGSCPEGAITVEERDAEPYDETRVMRNIIPQGPNVIRAHLEHLQSHGQDELLREAIACLVEDDIEVPPEFLAASACRCDETAPASAGGGCPGARLMSLDPHPAAPLPKAQEPAADRQSRLRQWPVQIMLVPTTAPFLEGADLLFAADCVPFAYPEFHEKLLRGRVCLVGCPKFDDAQHYLEKITEIFRLNDIRSVMIAYMEVPCCGGLVRLVEAAMAASGKNIPLAKQKISIHGDQI
jgi:ferredoxin